MASWRLAAAQVGDWVVSPRDATVGDTVWIERVVPAPPGWQVRAGNLAASPAGEPLGEPEVLRAAEGWRVRYPTVAWRPGVVVWEMPGVWRHAPDGRTDSLPGGTATFVLRSVIPDSVRDPAPRDLLAPVRRAPGDAGPAVLAALLSGGLLYGGLRLRRRPPRRVPPATGAPAAAPVPDARWLAAGEPRAVAARATGRLRAALARTVPEAHEALSTEECVAVVARARPHAPVREVGEVLRGLDQVAFAAAHGTDVAALAERARRLAQGLGS